MIDTLLFTDKGKNKPSLNGNKYYTAYIIIQGVNKVFNWLDSCWRSSLRLTGTWTILTATAVVRVRTTITQRWFISAEA